MNNNYTFELYYNTGGHGGPHPDIIMAETYARNLIAGDTSGRLSSVEIRPRNSKAIGGYAPNTPGSTYIERVSEITKDIKIERRFVSLLSDVCYNLAGMT